jgi:hypothetical protein
VTTTLTVLADRFGAEILPDNDQWKNRIQIRSESSDRLYTVAQRKSDGSWGCSCPGWKSSGGNRPRGCKHLTTMGTALRELR